MALNSATAFNKGEQKDDSLKNVNLFVDQTMNKTGMAEAAQVNAPLEQESS